MLLPRKCQRWIPHIRPLFLQPFHFNQLVFVVLPHFLLYCTLFFKPDDGVLGWLLGGLLLPACSHVKDGRIFSALFYSLYIPQLVFNNDSFLYIDRVWYLSLLMLYICLLLIAFCARALFFPFSLFRFLSACKRTSATCLPYFHFQRKKIVFHTSILNLSAFFFAVAVILMPQIFY